MSTPAAENGKGDWRPVSNPGINCLPKWKNEV
jgi:hypothetical protein